MGLKAWFEALGRGVAPLERPAGSRLAWILFGVALLFAIGTKSSLVVVPMLERSIPIEADDSFVRIYMSERNLDCFDQHCPGLESLRRQVAYAPKEDIMLWDIWSRTFIFSDPWFSLGLSGLKAIGIPLVKGHEYLAFVISVGIVAAIGYWLCQLFGPVSAGLSLIGVTLFVLPGDGLILFRPNELALGLSIFAWAEIARRGARSAGTLFWLIVLMSGAHLIGKAWSVVGLGVYAWSARAPLTVSQRAWWLGGAVVVVAAFLFPILYFSGSGVPTWDGLTQRSVRELLEWNLPMLMAMFKELAGQFKRPELFLALNLYGFAMLPLARRRHVLFWMFVFGALFLAALLEYHPTHPGHLLGRVIVPFTILVLGLSGYGLYALLKVVGGRIYDLLFRPEDGREPFSERASWVMASVFLIVLVDQFAFWGWKNWKLQPLLWERLISKHDFAFHPEQPQLLKAANQVCAATVYSDLTVMFYYFSNQAYHCGAYALTSDVRTRSWVGEQPKVGYLVTRGPLINNSGNLLVTGKIPATIHVEQMDSVRQPWRLYLRNTKAGEARVGLRSMVESESAESPVWVASKSLPGNGSGWWEVEGLPQARQFKLEVEEGAEVLVTAIRLDRGESSLRWPWNQGITLSRPDPKAEGGVRRIGFSSQGLWPEVARKVTIIDDSGSSVLAGLE
ncbi:MAG: hypothetical protein HQL86_01700 [Magnetococcales bacterium]|nr:hypothetical protein [Magnetococcales bacterium]